jgi:hypothetical protein
MSSAYLQLFHVLYKLVKLMYCVAACDDVDVMCMVGA